MHRACVQINLKHSNEQKTSQEFIIKLKASDTGGNQNFETEMAPYKNTLSYKFSSDSNTYNRKEKAN